MTYWRHLARTWREVVRLVVRISILPMLLLLGASPWLGFAVIGPVLLVLGVLFYGPVLLVTPVLALEPWLEEKERQRIATEYEAASSGRIQ